MRLKRGRARFAEWTTKKKRPVRAITMPLIGTKAWDYRPYSLRRLDLPLPTTPSILPRQHRRQELPGVAPLHLDHILGRALRDDLAAAVAALGAEVDQPVRGLD